MELKQFYEKGLAHLSYMLVGKDACIVIDPARDIAQYLELSEKHKLPITAIIETHLHADFVSGHMELANATGAKIYITAQADAAYAHYPVKDGEEFDLDVFHFQMINTPGHTPDCSVYIVSDTERGPKPAMIFTGDTVLIGDVGRPDLFPDIKDKLASALYRSLRKVENLGDQMELYPAHGAGSLCGKKLSAKLTSTLGIEHLYNIPMNAHPENAFIEALLDGMPEAPDHFSRCTKINRVGPSLISDYRIPRTYTPQEFKQKRDEGALIVDTRDQLAFCGAHIPGSYGLSIKGNFPTFSGWVLPPEAELLVIADSDEDFEAAKKALYSVGLDNVCGYLKGGMKAWADAGYLTDSIETMSVEQLHDCLEEQEIILIDTRLRSEYNEGHVPGSVHIPAPAIRTEYQRLQDHKRPIAFICNSGNRSLLASSLMKKYSSCEHIYNVIGGTSAWVALGYPITNEPTYEIES